MVLWFDIAPAAIVEHDHWHTHEHLPERLSIPGFLRGSRWKARSAPLDYFVLYEVEEVDTLVSGAYLERLNAPTPWTAKMMKHYRRMTRGFCQSTANFGAGVGQRCMAIRLNAAPGAEAKLREWLTKDALPALPSRAGLTGAHLLEAARMPPMTNEQRIRGADAAIDWVILVVGYTEAIIEELGKNELSAKELERRGAADVISGTYRMEYLLTRHLRRDKE